ncbi:MAG: glycosyltransferase family protein [Rhodospirillaceae bacterium]
MVPPQSPNPSNRPPRVLFHVQHLLGIGHVMRATALARAMAEAGIAVTVTSGGFPVPGADFGPVDFHQLPPMKAADATFKAYVTEGDAPAGKAFLEARRDRLIALADQVQPDVLMMEMFPFGRRVNRTELLPLIDHLRTKGCRIVCSVRDILVRKVKPGRDLEMIDIADRLIHLVLIHGDPALVRFEDTLPPAGKIKPPRLYTGLVTRTNPSPQTAEPGAALDGTGEVLVSAGGGATGLPLFNAALEARSLCAKAGRLPWRLLVGYRTGDEDFAALQAKAQRLHGEAVIVERARGDFPALIERAALSISQAGYNTVMDVIRARCPAVICPFDEAGENEQPFRAELLAKRGVVHLIHHPPGVAALAEAVEARLAAGPSEIALDLEGAPRAAVLIRRLAEGAEPSDLPDLAAFPPEALTMKPQ